MTQSNEEMNWKIVQTKTFTKWMNNQLTKKGYPPIENIFTDLSDGKVLAILIKILTGDILDLNKNTTKRIQKMENMQTIIKYIVERGVPLINIGNEDIVDGNEKLILGLIWTIILRFSISELVASDLSARDALLAWCRSVTEGYDNVNIKDFSKSWQDGLAFNAIIHHFRPELIGEYEKLSSKNKHENLQNAFDIAEEKLGINKLLDVEDIADVLRPDEKSVMTYVSQYYDKFIANSKSMAAKKRISDYIKSLNWSKNARNEYENRASEYISLADKTFRKDKEIEEKIIELYKLMNQKEILKNEMNYQFVYLNSLMGGINSIHEFYGMEKYTPPVNLGLSSLPRIRSTISENQIKSLDNLMDLIRNINEYGTIMDSIVGESSNVYQKCTPFDESMRELIEVIAKLESIAKRNSNASSSMEIEFKRLVEAIINIGDSKGTLLKTILKKKEEVDSILKRAQILYKSMEVNKKLSYENTKKCIDMLGFIPNINDSLLSSLMEGKEFINEKEFIDLVSKLYDLSFSIDVLKNDIETMCRETNNKLTGDMIGLSKEDIDSIANDLGEINISAIFK
ncbi:Alpha-actinin-like protein 1 [Astathelohania contejeani]|uniref:Alpha-actinin-like protein 1 n=1 Tax=Astathelohania contejeani TaxID=164912 RepID=A0ABQ7HZX9_9MICR|nr:Alpha-actinin-like protein 1 [Thelohania contejeani]